MIDAGRSLLECLIDLSLDVIMGSKNYNKTTKA